MYLFRLIPRGVNYIFILIILVSLHGHPIRDNIHGRSAGDAPTPHGLPALDPQMPHGRPTDSRPAVHGQPTATPRTPQGYPMGPPWAAYYSRRRCTKRIGLVLSCILCHSELVGYEKSCFELNELVVLWSARKTLRLRGHSAPPTIAEKLSGSRLLRKAAPCFYHSLRRRCTKRVGGLSCCLVCSTLGSLVLSKPARYVRFAYSCLTCDFRRACRGGGGGLKPSGGV